MTLNFVRALSMAALRFHHRNTGLGLFGHPAPLRRGHYNKIVDSIAESMAFFESRSGQRVACGYARDLYYQPRGIASLSEQAQTRYIERQKRW